jgi:hypothetical protein
MGADESATVIRGIKADFDLRLSWGDADEFCERAGDCG